MLTNDAAPTGMDLCDTCGTIIDVNEWHFASLDAATGEDPSIHSFCSRRCRALWANRGDRLRRRDGPAELSDRDGDVVGE
jgi:hypothetical protein